ncbi:MAG: tripartite tricarboxylate transporter substrate binding protein [Gammaproteobacteria bacterium]|nr:tripartite tricarboxylate transporter substrate binding protein [Gammaproteobacteria bacterium]
MNATRALAAMLVLLIGGVGEAQDVFPNRAVRIMIPYPAGGGTDSIGRMVADQLSRKWNQPVVVENVGGAAGNIGAAQVFKAPPDGHTLLIAAPGPIATNSFLYKDMPFDPARWTSIALLATGPYVLVLRKSFDGASVADLLARARSAPGKLTAAHPGVGSIAHLATVQFEMLAGIKTTLVPYRGLSPAVNDLIAGHVDLMFDTPTTALPLHREGRVRIIATGTAERVAEFPEIATIAETLPGYRSVTWYAMAAPPGMTPALADRINRDVNEILGRKEVAERVRSIQMSAVTTSRAAAAAFFADETQLWGRVIQQANIPPQ